MRYPINLSSEPFRRDRAVSVLAVFASALLTVTLVFLILLILNERHAKSDLVAAIAEAESQLSRMGNEQGKLEADMRRPQDADVLERSVFLNTLIARKGISWTKLFADVEGVLPFNVRLISVRPQANARNELQLDMYVAAQSGEPVIGFLKKLEGSEVFSNPTVANILPPSQTEPLYRYRVSVNYAQKL